MVQVTILISDSSWLSFGHVNCINGWALRSVEMGSCLSYDYEEKKAQARSSEIDKQLESLAQEESRVIKLLLLGEVKLPWWLECSWIIDGSLDVWIRLHGSVGKSCIHYSLVDEWPQVTCVCRFCGLEWPIQGHSGVKFHTSLQSLIVPDRIYICRNYHIILTCSWNSWFTSGDHWFAAMQNHLSMFAHFGPVLTREFIVQYFLLLFLCFMLLSGLQFTCIHVYDFNICNGRD